MSLSIYITKRKAPKPPLLRCVRDDGSETMAPVTVGVGHDLTHYAVETVLGLERGFYGLLGAGWSIDSFDTPGAAKERDIPAEASMVEFIVGLLQMEQVSGEPYEDFNAELARTVAGAKRPVRAPVPEISDAQIEAIRAKRDELMSRWLGLAPGETLELTFG